MRMCNLDMNGKVWLYTPQSHKTAYLGKNRLIPLGPKAQEVLRPVLKLDPQAFLFSPSEAEHERRLEQRRQRKSKVQPSQVERQLRARERALKLHGDCYTVTSYRRAIRRACKSAKVDPWTPNQLRHAAATRLRRELGIENARVVLGHSSPMMTEVYAEIDHERALAAMAEHG